MAKVEKISNSENGSGKLFGLVSKYEPAGDQLGAINGIVAGLDSGQKHQTILGVTGSGKTFTMAKIIDEVSRPAMIMAPNKTLAAQLYAELRDFFPNKRAHLHFGDVRTKA